MGVYAKSDSQAGPWKAPAGVRTGGLNAVSGLQYSFTNADLDNLNANNVNAIKAMPTFGCVVMGARTLSPLTAQRYINVRRLMSYIEVTVQQTLASALFESNDAVLWLQVATTVGTFLQNLFAQGAFAGSDSASSYYVICDSSVNTPQTIAAGQLICQVGIAPVTPAEFILMQMSQWANGATSSTTVSS
jgi:phage tail sheath protein FI